MTVRIENKSSLCVKAIGSCINVLLNEKADAEHIKFAASSLRTVLQNTMPFLRGEKEADDIVTAAVELSLENAKSLKNIPLDIIVKYLCDNSDCPADYAEFFVAKSVFKALVKRIFNEKIDYMFSECVNEAITDIDNDMCLRIETVTDILTGGNSPSTAAKQIDFIGEIYKVPTPRFIGDEKCHKLADIVMNCADMDFWHDKDFTLEVIYSVFNKINLVELVNSLSNKLNNKKLLLLSQLSDRYDIENTEIFIDDPYCTEKAKRCEFVKGLQKYTLKTLILTKNFLNEQGLRFYLTEGTLLGAVRHNGFIPWDDDIDIAMPRKDYNRLVELAKEGKIPPELNFDSLETNPKHWVLGAKMQLTEDTPYIQHKVTALSKCNGPYIDIFPLDCINKPYKLQTRFHNFCVKTARRMLFIKTGYSTVLKKKPSRVFLRIILPFISNVKIEKFAIKHMTAFYKDNPKFYMNFCSYYPYYKEVFPASFFGEPKYINFEGEEMPVPCEYDYILKTVYGKNYDTIPPAKVTNLRKHSFDLKN